MQVSDIAEVLSDHNGTLRCSRDATGAIIITVELNANGKGVLSVGGDLKSVLTAARKECDRMIKNRDVVPLQTTKQK